MIIVRTDSVLPPDVPVPTPPQERARIGFGLSLITTDGTVWDLANGPVYALAGAAGLGAPKPEHRWRSSSAWDGSTWQGQQTGMRENFPFPLEVSADGPMSWLDTDRALWAGLDPNSEVVFVVAMPDNTVRQLIARYADGGDVELDVDPNLVERIEYPTVFSAGDPYWRGQTVSALFAVETPRPFFAPADQSPPAVFNIGSSSSIAEGTINNPGNQPAWPRWIANGPLTSFTVGVGSSIVTLVANVPAGQSRVIDMDPRRRTVKTGTGADAWLELTQRKFAQIPPGVDVDLNLDVAGAGVGTSIELQFDPRYRRAW